MYSVILMASFGVMPDIPEAHRRSRAAAGCHGTQSVARSQGCQSDVQYSARISGFTNTVQYVAVPVQVSAGCQGFTAAGCAGGTARGFTPVRNALARHDARVASRVDARAARHGGESTYFLPASAVAVNTSAQAPVPQSHCPPAAKP